MQYGAVVSLARHQAMGEVRRVGVVASALHRGGRRRRRSGRHPRPPPPPRRGDRRRGRADRARAARVGPVAALVPRAGVARGPTSWVVASTRAFDPAVVAGPWHLVVDQVDSLARSYRDRAAVVHGLPRRGLYRDWAPATCCVERRLQASDLRRVAVGWTDVWSLDAEWVPNLLDDTLAPRPDVTPDCDVLFFGTPPLPAEHRRARASRGGAGRNSSRWRPGTSSSVAGVAPTDRVAELCRQPGWELVADFDRCRRSLGACAVGGTTHTRRRHPEQGARRRVLRPRPGRDPRRARGSSAPAFRSNPSWNDAALAAAVVESLDDDALPRARSARSPRPPTSKRRTQRGVWLPWAEALFGGHLPRCWSHRARRAPGTGGAGATTIKQRGRDQEHGRRQRHPEQETEADEGHGTHERGDRGPHEGPACVVCAARDQQCGLQHLRGQQRRQARRRGGRAWDRARCTPRRCTPTPRGRSRPRCGCGPGRNARGARSCSPQGGGRWR